MSDKAKKQAEKTSQSQSQGKLLIAGIAAAVEKSMTSAFTKLQADGSATQEKILSTLESISASQAELVQGLRELALGKLDSVQAEAEGQEDGEEQIEAGADMSDPSMAAHGDPSAASDPSADGEEDGSDPTEMEAEGDPTNYTSSEYGDDAEPGDLNKDTVSNQKSNARQGSTNLKPGGPQISKGIAASKIAEISAAARTIRKLESERQQLRNENVQLKAAAKKQGTRLQSIEASLERYAERVERKSVTPEIHALLEKNGFDVRELMASHQKLSVADVDQMFASMGVPLEPQVRAAFKNQMLQLGLMEDGAIRRFGN